MGHRPDQKARKRRRDREAAPSFADELRERAASAPERKAREEAEKARKRHDDAVDTWYTQCRDEARKEADASKREARVATGYSTQAHAFSAEDDAVLRDVAEKLRTVDKLRMRREVVESGWVSDDTGEPFTKETLVLVITW